MRLLDTRRACLRTREAHSEYDAPARVAAATARVLDVDAPPRQPRELLTSAVDACFPPRMRGACVENY